MAVAKKAAAASKTTPAPRKVQARRTASTASAVAGSTPGAYSDVDLRVWAINTAVNVFGGTENQTASKLVTQAKRFEAYASGKSIADDES